MTLKWEEIARSNKHDSATYRARAPGGWIVRHLEWAPSDGDGWNLSTSLVYVPDREHLWGTGT